MDVSIAPTEMLSARALLAVTALALLTVIGVTALSVAPRAGRAVAVMAWPGAAGEAADVVADAGGELLAAGAGGFVIAQSTDEGFVARLYRGGALLVVDASAAPLCAASKTSPERGGR